MIRFLEADDPNHDWFVRIWQLPRHDRGYIIGADVAEGLDHGDYSAAHVLDARTGAQVAVWHGHTPADVFGDELAMLGKFYNGALIGVEANNHGLTTVTRLRQLGYPNLYRDRKVDEITKKVTLKYGWYTTRITKPLIIDGLDQAMREQSITLYDKRTIAELRTYVRDEKAKMHGSPHDDLVISLAIAVEMMKYGKNPTPINEVDDSWTVDWWWRQVARDEPKVLPIGHHNRRTSVR